MPGAGSLTLSRFPVVVALAVLLAASAAAQAAPDFSQADAMLGLLRSCHENRSSTTEIGRFISFPGTDLVIGQQNISRRVTKRQYREVLQAACSGKVAEIKRAEPGARAEKGVTGLTQDVAPSIIWGRDHIPLLESSLKELRENQSVTDAIPLARKYLPQQMPLAPKLYVVMGGRAGATAIEDQLYFDVLITDWRVSRGTAAPLSPHEVVEFFAHETHHLGYGQILDLKRASLNLNPAESQAWNFLVATMMEGSATLLINGHESLEDLEQQPDIKPYLAKVPSLLPAMQDILRQALNGPVSGEDYAEATTPFFDMGYHATVAVLLAAIKKKQGLAGVMQVMADPRQLLTAFNDSASASTVPFRFDPALAQRVAHLGDAKVRDVKTK